MLKGYLQYQFQPRYLVNRRLNEKVQKQEKKTKNCTNFTER